MYCMRKKIFKIGLAVVFIGLVLVAGYRFYFVKMIRVPTGAMANTILPGDMLAAKRTLGTVKRGDIVIFKYPRDVSVQYVSRVIGLPRETIQIRDRLVYINGDEIPERRVTVKPDDYLESDSLEELSSEGSGAYRVFYVSRDNKFGSGTPANLSQVGSFGTEGPFQ